MTTLRTRRFAVAELGRDRLLAGEWNALWERSPVVVPTARAEHVVNWAQHFAAGRQVDAYVFEDAGRWIGALPLISGRVARQPWNYWAWGSELLLDDAVSTLELDAVADALASIPAAAIRLDAVRVQRDHWPELLAALARRGTGRWVMPRYAIEEVALAPDGWDAFLATRSKGHRRKLRRALRNAADAGGVELRIEYPRDAAGAERHVRAAFACEQRSWKAEHGACVADDPAVLAYILDQARLLAAHGMLEVVFLDCGGEIAAFEYGWRAKRRYFSPKISFDRRYAQMSPGHLLRMLHTRELFAAGEVDGIDFLGPKELVTVRWATGEYLLGRVVLATGGPLSRTALAVARRGGPAALRLRYRVRERVKARGR